MYGDTAVVTYSSNDKGTYKGKDITARTRWTDVFVRRNASGNSLPVTGAASQSSSLASDFTTCTPRTRRRKELYRGGGHPGESE
jgi:hypothetical protein